MVVLPDHSHCKYCGNPTKYGDDYCDGDCEELFVAQEAEEKRKDYIFYGAIALSLVAILFAGVIIRMFV